MVWFIDYKIPEIITHSRHSNIDHIVCMRIEKVSVVCISLSLSIVSFSFVWNEYIRVRVSRVRTYDIEALRESRRRSNIGNKQWSNHKKTEWRFNQYQKRGREKEVWKEMGENFIMKTKFMMVTNGLAKPLVRATWVCACVCVYCALHCLSITLFLSLSMLLLFAVFFHRTHKSTCTCTLSLSFLHAITHSDYHAKKLSSYAWFVQKNVFFFFKNQVNDECKVGHFADTHKCALL